MIIIDDDGVMHNVLSIGVLDNIRADIEKECVTCEYEDDFVYNSGLLKAIEIIDKYRKGVNE